MKHLLILITIFLSVLYSEHSRTPILIPKETITEYDITITTGFYTYDRNYNAVPVWKNKPHDSGIYVLIEKNDVGIFYHEVEPRRTRWDVVPPMKLVDYIKSVCIEHGTAVITWITPAKKSVDLKFDISNHLICE